MQLASLGISMKCESLSFVSLGVRLGFLPSLLLGLLIRFARLLETKHVSVACNVLWWMHAVEAVVGVIAEQFSLDREAHDVTAADWTSRFAKF